MAKINQKEYDILKGLDDEWKWIVRDENGKLYKFLEKPRKVNDFNWKDPENTWLRMDGDNFQFIQWEDEEPYNIQELILEYERDRLIKLFSCWGQEVSGKISEGMKNIGLAINEILSEESEETEE